ncbi:hypothetical protein BT93_C1204 [Corymbia citriodora subsp. variegata]|nr:hypothetical protein BT93_C1204 [Corymbia citriodora subsp. variegata]KAF8035100.1 hypothetical protein BT93_C1204 [Corymbia citriodora subsp. variegata]
MAASKLVIVAALAFFLLAGIWVPSIRADDDDGAAAAIGGPDSSALKAEVEQLKAKIQVLDSFLNEKTKGLQTKDKILAEKEKIIKEKLDKVALLQSEVSSLQKKGKLDAAADIEKAHARATELEKQVEKLKTDIESQLKEKEVSESRAIKAEKRMNELNAKLENLQKINDEQKSKIRKTERALKVAEEELMKAKIEAASKHKELTEVRGAWLPHWLAIHHSQFQSFIELHWNEHGKPAMNTIIQKTSEKKSQAAKWAEPHLETMKKEWIPAIKEHCLTVKTSLEPHVHSLTTKTVEVYESSKTALTPHLTKAQEVADPYYQEVKKFSKPHIDNIVTVTKPHVDKLRLTLKPYTKEVVRVYGKFLKSASSYHHQVQAQIRETLNKDELTRPLATKEFVWFVASALLALPIIILSKFLSALFGTKAKKPARNAQKSHTRRKAKRGHPDK